MKPGPAESRYWRPAARRADDRQRLARWRLDHPHDTVQIIRAIRNGEAA